MADKQEEKIKVYVLHCYHDDRPQAVFLNRSEAWDLACEHPRSFIYEIEIPVSRWVSVGEINARVGD